MTDELLQRLVDVLEKLEARHRGDRQLLDLDALRAKLRVSTAWWAKFHDQLYTLGFPPPVEGLGYRWDPVAVDAWLDRKMPAHLRDRGDEVVNLKVIEHDMTAFVRGQMQSLHAGAN